MRERIIFAPGLNGSELMKTLALHGVNTINIRTMGAMELARLALMKSGIKLEKEILGFSEVCALMAQAVEAEEYFGKTNYADIQKIANAIQTLRSLCTVHDTEAEEAFLREKLNQAIFKEKNEALLRVYQRYMQLLDEKDAMDQILLIRKAIQESCPLSAELIRLEEYQLNPLEMLLFRKLCGCTELASFSDNDQEGKCMSISALFSLEEKEISIDSYRNCYGAANEVESILSDIYREKKLDSCTVAVSDPRVYGQLFFDASLLYEIPVSFGCGIPILNSNPAKLLVLYNKWAFKDFFSGISLINMISADCFDRKALQKEMPEKPDGYSQQTYREMLASIRLTNDRAENLRRIAALKKAVSEESMLIDAEDTKQIAEIEKKKACIPQLEKLAQEICLPMEVFIKKYAYIRRGSSYAEELLMQLDQTALSVIYNELLLAEPGQEGAANKEDLIQMILQKSVCKQASSTGCLHISEIKDAMATLRENLYITGLSASNFPGSPTENYLILDNDLAQFGEASEYLSSAGRILQKKACFHSLVRLATDLGTRIHLSYAGMNVAELKKDNASSVLFEVFQKDNQAAVSVEALEARIEKVDYFASSLSASKEVGLAYNSGKIILQSADTFSDGDVLQSAVSEGALAGKAAEQSPAHSYEAEQSANVRYNAWNDQEWSPSAIHMFLECPRRFLIRYGIGIPEPEEEKAFEILSALDNGTMAHALLEQLANADISRENFLKMSSEAFDRFITTHPPLIKSSVPAVRTEFMDLMATAYDMDPHREVVLKEEDIRCRHESGVRIYGLPDRVERMEDGSVLIVDFKSSRQISHVEDDIYSCIQIVIYAYLLEQQGYQVSGGEFRYIRLGKTVRCRYDDQIKAQLTEVLTKLKYAFETFSFPVLTEEEADAGGCRYCKYSGLCNREEKGDK